MHGTVTLVTQIWGWAGVKGLQALLYAALRKPLWMLGPHFKCLFILALITRSSPTADSVVCVCKELECNTEVPRRKWVSLTKHDFLACSVGFSEVPWWSCNLSNWNPSGCTTSDSDLCRPFYLTLLSNLITIMYIRALLLLLIVAGCYNQISLISHNGRLSCLRGYRRLLVKKKQVDGDGDFF